MKLLKTLPLCALILSTSVMADYSDYCDDTASDLAEGPSLAPRWALA
ncbi:hypothetical protein [Vibrio mexicanus]|nr:hypothetical protein [Vibrio mexicanus]